MREMHKWKDKVEFSLDNRQIFFLFFGLSVVACFVFALGIMTGRRLQWEPGQQAAAVGGDSLAMLDDEDGDGDGDGDGEGEVEERFAFKRGLTESDAEAVPPTRDPEVPPADDDEVAARKQAEQQQADQAEIDAKIEEQQQALAATKPEAAKPEAAKPEAGSAGSAGDDGKRLFTLQMKAFSREEDATKLAEKLRHNGHDVRVESHDVRGRTWHRVRLGAFDDWNEALAAKDAFEKAEHVIAYVVSL